MTVINKRVHTRKLFNTMVIVTYVFGQKYEAKTIDISVGGLSILLPKKALMKNTICQLDFNLLFNKQVHKIHVSATVIHSISSTNGFKTGMVFVDLDKDTEKLFKDFSEAF